MNAAFYDLRQSALKVCTFGIEPPDHKAEAGLRAEAAATRCFHLERSRL
jgi:hypothetical protein